jgi:hypothetical protein
MKYFHQEIVRSIKDGEVLDVEQYAFENIRLLKAGKCTPDDSYLDDLFQQCDCGSSKFLYPNLKVNIGQTTHKDGYYEYVSYDYLQGFIDYLEYYVANPDEFKMSEDDEDEDEDDEEEESSGSDTSGSAKGSGIKGTKFYEELRRYGIKPEDYLKQMKIWAKKSGYDEKQMVLDNDDIHKIRMMTENGTRHFGRVGYKDYYIYRHLEKKKEVPKGTANKMRNRFRKSHEAISKKRKLGRNTPNELSLKILWHESSDDIKK